MRRTAPPRHRAGPRPAAGTGRLAGLTALLLLTTLLVAGTPAAPAQAHRADWGKLTAQDGKLRKGCHDYPYRYRLTPPEGDWALETFLVDRRGRKLGSGLLLPGSDALAGRKTFRVCRATTVPGRFRINGRLTVQNGPDERYVGWVKPATFRLRKR